MKAKLIFTMFSVFMMLLVNACSGDTETAYANHDSLAASYASENVEDTISSVDSETYRTEEIDNQAAENNTSSDETGIGETTMIMKIGDTKVNVDWEDNQAVAALRDMAKGGDVIIQMSMYGGFEQVGSIGQSLPRDDKQTTTSSGDIVLYSGNQIVVFYGSNSWSYTRLGHISDKDEADMTDLLSNGDVTITIGIE